ncbi:Pr6Pr family membrane protein [Microcella alkaliphila]|uniref:Pr6Pr family membrane protein n=1 Tax=Microcella alkaliphila TaxID=279828 RepID=UPI001028C5FF|nr:Pr6Pr family membrane protein [Microcella alkaliphila]
MTATSAPEYATASRRLVLLRRIAGILSLAASATVFAALVTQITDQISVGRFEPTEYFAFFTIQTAMINIVVLAVGGVLALRAERDTRLYTAIRASVFSYAVVTGVVYNLLLRDVPNDDGYVGPWWPNEALHVWVPIYIAVDWMLATGRPRIAWSTMWLAVSYPLIWVGVTMLRGAADGWYPYPFLEPFGPNGVPGVAAHVVAIAALIIGLTAIAVTINHLQTRGVHGQKPTALT